MAEPRIFDTYAEAGAFLQDNNPDLKMQPDVAARKFEEKNPHVMRVMEGMGTMETMGVHAMSGVNAANRIMGQIPDPVSDVIQPAIGGIDSLAGYLNQGQQDAGAGVSSGVSMGATEQLSQAIGNEPKSGLAFGAGEMVGEMIGTYKAAGMLLGSTATGAKLAAQTGAKSILGRAALGGAEAAMVETPKSFIRGENLSEAAAHGAMGFGMGAAFTGLFRGLYVGGRAGVRKWLGPKEGEMDPDMVAFVQEEGLEGAGIASVLRPTSDMVNFVERRTMASAATRKIYNNARERLINVVDTMQNRLTMKLGDNVTALPPSEVGAAVVNDIDNSLTLLRDAKNAKYDAVGLSEIGEVPIKPNHKVELQYPNEAGELGDPVETSLLDGLADIIGRDLINGNVPPATSTAVRKLIATYKWMKRNATKVEDITEEYHDASATHFADPHINPTTGKPMPYKNRAPAEGPNQSGVRQDLQGKQQVESPGEYGSRLDIQGAPMTSKTTTEVSYKSYNWWWKRAREIGDMLDQKSVVETPADKAKVGKAYHLIRDVIDNYASQADPSGLYKLRIDAARASHINFTTFKNHPTVKKIFELGNLTGKSIAEPEKVMPTIFDSVSSIKGIKQLLGPEVFNQVRQSWIHDLLIDSIEVASNGTLKNVVARKLISRIQKYGGMEGEKMPEMFSDEGFFTPDGMPMSSNFKSPIKFEEFKDFVKKVGLLNDATELLESGGKIELTSAERLSGSSFSNPGNLFQQVRAALATMLTAKHGAEELLKPMSESRFLGGGSPEKALFGGEETLGRGATMTANRIFNR